MHPRKIKYTLVLQVIGVRKSFQFFAKNVYVDKRTMYASGSYIVVQIFGNQKHFKLFIEINN